MAQPAKKRPPNDYPDVDWEMFAREFADCGNAYRAFLRCLTRKSLREIETTDPIRHQRLKGWVGAVADEATARGLMMRLGWIDPLEGMPQGLRAQEAPRKRKAAG